MEKSFSKYIILFRNILCFIFCFYLVFIYLKYDVLTGHDHFFEFEYVARKSMFSTARFISRFIVAAFYVFIPNIIKIHPNNMSNTIVPLFSAFVLSIITLFSMKIFYLFFEIKKSVFFRKSFFILYPAIFVIISIIPLINENMYMFYFSSLAETVTFYDYLFNFVFFTIFFYAVLKCVFNGIENIYLKILYLINSFLLGISFEMLTFVSVTYIVTVCLFMFYLYKKEKSETNSKKLLFLFLNMVVLFVSGLLHLFLSGYSQGRIAGYDVNLKDFLFTDIKEIILPFLQNYFNIVICENLGFLIIIAILSFLLFKTKSETKTDIKVLFLSSSLILCIFIFFFALIIGGKCQVYNYDFWISHIPFRIFYFKILLLIILFYFGYIISNLKNKKISYIVYSVLVLMLYTVIFVNIVEIKKEWSFQQINSKDLRKTVYITDKMSILYNKLDGIAILPISSYKKYSSAFFIYRPRCYDADAVIREKMKRIVDKEIALKKTRLFVLYSQDGEYNADNDYLYYLYYTYGIRLEGVIFVDDNVAFKEFRKRGGVFSDKELKKTDFTFLKNKYNTKYSLDELNNLIKENRLAPFLYAARGRYYYSEGEYEKAVNDYSNAIILSKTLKNYYNQYFILRAQSYIEQKDYKKAALDYERFINTSPFSIEFRKKLANIYAKNELYDKAIEQYNKIIEIFPYYNELGTKKTFYEDLALIYYKQGNFKEVINSINMDEKLFASRVNYKLRFMAKIKNNDLEGAYNDLIIIEQKGLFYDKEKLIKLKELIIDKIYAVDST